MTLSKKYTNSIIICVLLFIHRNPTNSSHVPINQRVKGTSFGIHHDVLYANVPMVVAYFVLLRNDLGMDVGTVVGESKILVVSVLVEKIVKSDSGGLFLNHNVV